MGEEWGPVTGPAVVDQAVTELPAGSLVRLADSDALALLAGYDPAGDPLVIDLPPARVHQPGVVKA